VTSVVVAVPERSGLYIFSQLSELGIRIQNGQHGLKEGCGYGCGSAWIRIFLETGPGSDSYYNSEALETQNRAMDVHCGGLEAQNGALDGL
jgi:hypothetical protein